MSTSIQTMPLTTPEAAKMLGVSARTLEGWRRRGRGEGPPYRRFGHSVVRYDSVTLMQWMLSQERAA